MSKSFFQNTIALVYDFDGTLSPQPMQEYTVLPKIGIEPAVFWAKVHKEALDTGSDPMLVYMRLMMEALYKNEDVRITREDFAAMAQRIQYFPGVEEWFPRINAYVKKRGGGAADQAFEVKDTQRDLLRAVMMAISDTAKAMEAAFDGIADKYKMPENRSDQNVLSDRSRAPCP